MAEKKVYQKANSFIEIRRTEKDKHDLLAAIRRVLTAMEKKDDYFSNIVRTACNDLLAEPSATVAFQLFPHIEEEMERLSEESMPRYLFYRYRYDIFPQEKKLDKFPPCLQIEPTSVCNYRCVFCYQTDKEFTNPKNGHMGTMSVELFKNIIDQAQGNVEAVTLASRGEPLMARGIDDMLAYASGKFLGFKINTNASFLDEKHAHALLSAEPNTLVFSADAAAEPLYSQLRVNGNLEKVLTNIRRFLDIKSKQYPSSKIITRVSGVRFSKDQSLDDMERLWGDLVDQVAFVDYNPWEHVYTAPLNNIETPCSDLWRRTFIWWDGRMNPCDVDVKSTLAVGNVLSSDISSLWTGEKYNSYREAHLERRRNSTSPCNRCTVI